MDFCHNNQIVTGAGRGSAAGSLVSYVLSITDVDQSNMICSLNVFESGTLHDARY